jgi:WD40 repeat protein
MRTYWSPKDPAWADVQMSSTRSGKRRVRFSSLALAAAILALMLACQSGSARPAPHSARSTLQASMHSSPISRIPSRPHLSGRLVFARAGRSYGDETVFTARADGTHIKQIAEPMTTCCPRLSRDGRKIVVSASAPDGQRVTAEVLNYDGTGAKKLALPTPTFNFGVGAWSPDRSHLALQGWDDTHPSRAGMFIARADGTHLKRISTTPAGAGADTPVDYSPDGRHLLVFRESEVQSVGSLWIVGTDGRHWRRLTPTSVHVGIGGRWSPDGSRIVFAAGRDQATGRVYTIRADGTGLKTILAGGHGRYALTPTWSPDGRQIMFAIDPVAAEFTHPDNGLYVIHADGTHLALVIGSADFKREPDWAA